MGDLKSLREKLPNVINKILFQTLDQVSSLIEQELEIPKKDIKIRMDAQQQETVIIFPYKGVNATLTIIPEEFIFGKEEDEPITETKE